MSAEELLDQGRLGESLDALQAEVRAAPADALKRLFLFQILSVMGQWDRALTQLNTAAQINSQLVLSATIYRAMIAAEQQRSLIFAGEKNPTIFGEPEPWVAALVQANQAVARGRADEAKRLRSQALRGLSPVAGTINGQPFKVLTDADSRLGPVLEAVVEGAYYWVPITRIAKVEIHKPTDLQDLVWAPAMFTWVNGGTVAGYIPVRYAGSEMVDDPEIRLSRKTAWETPAENYHIGLGQRLIGTDVGTFGLLEVERITFDVAVAQATAPEVADVARV